MEAGYLSEVRGIVGEYDLGELVACDQDQRGTVNTSFVIMCAKDGEWDKYFLRRYKLGVQEEEIAFEHSVTQHLIAHSRLPVARVYRTQAGKSYLRRPHPVFQGEQAFYAMFEFLPGRDKYSWVDTRLTDEEVRSSARVLAEFHDAVSYLLPAGRRHEPKMRDLLPEITASLRRAPQNNRGTPFDQYLLEHHALLLDEARAVQACLDDPRCQSLPEVVIHCDYHPGNLKFEDGRVTALFDFDWSKIDTRAFDVGLALFYFFAEWQAEMDGSLRLEPLGVFLQAYQDRLREAQGIGPLIPAELEYLPVMIRAGNLFVLYWAMKDYFSKDVDPQEYLGYLRHNVNLIGWLRQESNAGQLKAICTRTVLP
ncbi:MAG TPA: phosphotransferase [Anaerolineales bacterium]|nr:phosphotransferase [Anaerolineales bacterium]